MLALPLTIGLLGLFWGSIALIGLWGLMAYGSLVTLEVNLMAGKGLPISLLVRPYLGPRGEDFTVLITLVLFWTLLAAYLTGTVSLLSSLCSAINIEAPTTPLTMGVAAILSLFLLVKLEWLDIANRLLIIIKAVAFAGMLILLYPLINHTEPLTLPVETLQIRPWALALPVLFAAFGFHGSIHSLINYADKDPRTLRIAFIGGSFIALIVYLLWIWVSLGALLGQSPEAAAALAQGSGDIGAFMNTLSKASASKGLSIFTWLFSILAIATSALGVALGLFDLFIEKLRLAVPHVYTHRLLGALLTFVVPTITALYFPHAFVAAIRFSAIFLSIIATLLPAWIVFKGRLEKRATPYRACGGRLGLLLLFLGGATIIGLEVYTLI